MAAMFVIELPALQSTLPHHVYEPDELEADGMVQRTMGLLVTGAVDAPM